MSTDKVDDDDGQEGSSADLAVPENPCTDTIKPLRWNSTNEFSIGKKTWFCGNEVWVFSFYSVSLYITFGILVG